MKRVFPAESPRTFRDGELLGELEGLRAEVREVRHLLRSKGLVRSRIIPVRSKE